MIRGKCKTYIMGALVCVFLAFVFTILFNILFHRWEGSFDMSRFGVSNLTERTREILAETDGTIQVFCLMSQETPESRMVGRLLREIKITAREVAGGKFNIFYVDPRRDYSQAVRLANLGAKGEGVLFQRSHRAIFVSLSDMREIVADEESFLVQDKSDMSLRINGENVCVAAIARLFRKDGITVYWMKGHGEPDFADTTPNGFSVIYRALQADGFQLKPLKLIESRKIPEDCEVLMIMAPKYALTLEERAIIADFLDKGGRLFIAMPSAGDAGLGALLDQWSISVSVEPIQPSVLLNYSLSVADGFAEHSITRAFREQTSLFFGVPRSSKPISNRSSRDVHLTPLVTMKTASGANEPVICASERGMGLATDIAYRSARIIVAGDASFASNVLLANKMSANRDFMLNSIQWLAGVHSGRAHSAQGFLDTKVRDAGWGVLFGVATFATPLAVLLMILVLARKRK